MSKGDGTLQEPDEVVDEAEAAHGAAIDAFMDGEEKARAALGQLTDAQLDTLANSSELAGGWLGLAVASAARMTIAFRDAKNFMSATGAKMATWPEVHAWKRTKGDA